MVLSSDSPVAYFVLVDDRSNFRSYIVLLASQGKEGGNEYVCHLTYAFVGTYHVLAFPRTHGACVPVSCLFLVLQKEECVRTDSLVGERGHA